jgi:hypothetical protein
MLSQPIDEIILWTMQCGSVWLRTRKAIFVKIKLDISLFIKFKNICVDLLFQSSLIQASFSALSACYREDLYRLDYFS